MVNVNKNFEIHQIFYDEKTRLSVPPAFTPLSNIGGDSSWYEFLPILRFLQTNELRSDVFYGFLSPKFCTKFGVEASELLDILRSSSTSDAVLFSYGWDQLCFFLNPWEQGELWHPGILKATQDFLEWARIPIDVSQLICTRRNSVFSNFIVAKPEYWARWRRIAEKFLEYCEDSGNHIHNSRATHRGKVLPMKVFIQERFPALILSDGSLSTLSILPPLQKVRFSLLQSSEDVKGKLFACDQLKEEMLLRGVSDSLIQQFLDLRATTMKSLA